MLKKGAHIFITNKKQENYYFLGQEARVMHIVDGKGTKFCFLLVLIEGREKLDNPSLNLDS